MLDIEQHNSNQGLQIFVFEELCQFSTKTASRIGLNRERALEAGISFIGLFASDRIPHIQYWSPPCHFGFRVYSNAGQILWYPKLMLHYFQHWCPLYVIYCLSCFCDFLMLRLLASDTTHNQYFVDQGSMSLKHCQFIQALQKSIPEVPTFPHLTLKLK